VDFAAAGRFVRSPVGTERENSPSYLIAAMSGRNRACKCSVLDDDRLIRDPLEVKVFVCDVNEATLHSFSKANPQAGAMIVPGDVSLLFCNKISKWLFRQVH
jgi:hypothetical protein